MILGLNNDQFIVGKVPITKPEVRAITISKLELNTKDIVIDIGAGTGSISIECGLNCTAGKVISIEKKEKAIDLIKKNITKFKLSNIELIHAQAKDALVNIDKADKVVIGGSSGQLEEIVSWCNEKLVSRVVANFISIENLYHFVRLLKEYDFRDIDIVQALIAKGKSIGDLTLMMANNPVFIVSANKGR